LVLLSISGLAPSDFGELSRVVASEFMPNANEAILLTPPGAGAIAVVRLRGPNVRQFLAQHFSTSISDPMRCRHGNLIDENKRIIDDPVVVLSEDNQSADLNLHGGTWVVTAALGLAERSGFSVVQKAGVDVTATIEQEVLESLPLARTELALWVLLNQVEAWKELNPGHENANQILANRSLHWLLHPPRVAIVGAPNVGKSTLANQLFARERSITADLPGTTRDWVGEIANLDGLAVMLVDTPGLRETDDAIEREAIARSRKQIQRADLILHVLDVTEPDGQLKFDQAIVIRVLNKCDLPAKWPAQEGDLKVCAKTGEGIAVLIDRIKHFFHCSPIDVTAPRCWTERQRQWIRSHLL
jgi:small GTP-binding protein